MTALLVRKVQSPADVAALMTAGNRAESGNSRWIGPLREEMHRAFDRRRLIDAFSVRGIQVDGGSEFRSAFDKER